MYDRKKNCIYVNGAYFDLKKVYVFLMCPRFLKNFGPHYVSTNNIHTRTSQSLNRIGLIIVLVTGRPNRNMPNSGYYTYPKHMSSMSWN
jgi:hypothetical protein